MSLPTARKLARWMAYAGLVCGVVYSVGGLIYDALTIGLNWGKAMAFGALIGMPLIFGAIGFALGAVFDVVAAGVRALRGGRAGRTTSSSSSRPRCAAVVDGYHP